MQKSITFTEHPVNQTSKLRSEIILFPPNLKDAYFLGAGFAIPLAMKEAVNILHHLHQTEGYHSPYFQMQGQKHLLNISVIFAS